MFRLRTHCLRGAVPALLLGILTSPLGAGEMGLIWDPNRERDLAGYRVHVGLAPRSYIYSTDIGLSTTFTSDAFEGGVTYYFAVTAYDTAGNESDYSEEVSGKADAPVSVDDGGSGAGAPRDFALLPNYPNPFNPITTLAFQIPSPPEGEVRRARVPAVDASLVVYSARGHRVRTLLQERLLPGTYRVTWDGTDDRGAPQPSGIYLCRLTAGASVATRRMALTR